MSSMLSVPSQWFKMHPIIWLQLPGWVNSPVVQPRLVMLPFTAEWQLFNPLTTAKHCSYRLENSSKAWKGNKLSSFLCSEGQEEGAASLQRPVGLCCHIWCLILMLNDLRRTSRLLHKGANRSFLLFQFLDLLQFLAFTNLNNSFCPWR